MHAMLPFFKSKIAITAILALALSCATGANATPLDDYVAKEDPAFSYTVAKTIEEPAYTATVYDMKSQNWLDESQVDRTLWQHWVTVIVPKEVTQSEALLFISGGSNRGGDAPTPDGPLSQVAITTKAVLVDVKQIPNQPLHFPDEHDDRYKDRGRSEDEMIAYGWDKFLVTQDPIWLARLPMTKAVVRAMDLVQKEHAEVDGFFVAGGSKRGWTTWTVAAVDKRVVGIAPAVIDVLNVVQSMDNHYAAYGFWAPAVGDYEDLKVLDRIHTPEFAKLCEIVDPLSYKDRLTMPKYIINSAGDQFFPPNSWEFYFDELKGEKYLRYMANTDHGLSMEAYFNLASFYHAVINDTPRPEFAWKKLDDGTLEVNCVTPPTKVLLWEAHNPDARDFRLETLGAVWKSTLVEPTDGIYRAAPNTPDNGWRAYFLEMEFPNPGFSMPFKFTTGICVTPDTFPHADKVEE